MADWWEDSKDWEGDLESLWTEDLGMEDSVWQEVWTSWCSSSICPLEGSLSSTTQLLTTSATPTTALRTAQKTGGLFDTCGSGVTDGKVTSVDTAPLGAPIDTPVSQDFSLPVLSSVATNNNDDFLLSSLSDASSSGLDGLMMMGDVAMSYSGMTPSFQDASMSIGGGTRGDVNNEDFCEVFTDLSDFLLENVGSMDIPIAAAEAPAFAPVSTPTQGSSSRKRTATEALLEAMEYTEEQEEAVPSTSSNAPDSPIPVDHDLYTFKPKRTRGRPATVTSESDLESIASTSSSRTPIEKAVERRVKNNIASRRSRETRKQKFSAMELEAQKLERENKELEKRIVELEALTKEAKAKLIDMLANKKK